METSLPYSVSTQTAPQRLSSEVSIEVSDARVTYEGLFELQSDYFDRKYPQRANYIVSKYYRLDREQRQIYTRFGENKSAASAVVANLPSFSFSIFAPPGGGVTTELLHLVRQSLRDRDRLAFYLDLREVGLESGLHSSVIYSEFDSMAARLGWSFNELLEVGNVMLAIDNFDRVPFEMQRLMHKFIDSFYYYEGDRHQIVIGSNSPIAIGSWQSVEIAPVDAAATAKFLEPIGFSTTPKHFQSRVTAAARLPLFLATIVDIANTIGRCPDNLALVYQTLLPTYLARLRSCLGGNGEDAALLELLYYIVDSREESPDFELLYWHDSIATLLEKQELAVFKRDSQAGTFTPQLLLQALIKSGIFEQINDNTVAFRDKSLQHFLLAKCFIDEGMTPAVFTALILGDRFWQPVVLYFLELSDRQDIPEIIEALKPTIQELPDSEAIEKAISSFLDN